MKSVRFNWAAVLAFATLWSYGLFGSGFTSSQASLSQFWITSIFVSGLFSFYFTAWHQNWDSFKTPFLVDVGDLLFLALSITLYGFVGWSALHHSIEGDQVYHAQRALLHPLYILAKVQPLLSTGALGSAFNLTWVASALTLFGFATACFWLFKKNGSFSLKLIAAIFLIIGLRFGIQLSGGNPDPHAPLRLLPLWLSASILGPTDFAFRMPQLMALIGLTWVVYRWLSASCGLAIAVAGGLASGLFPLVFHVSTLAEQSIYTCLAWTFVLLGLERAANPLLANGWIAIATLFRLPSFIAAIPIGGLWLFQARKLSSLFPLAVFLPFLLQSLIFGTPSTPKNNSLPLPEVKLVWDILTKDLSSLGVFFLCCGLVLSWFDDQRKITPLKGLAVTGLFLMAIKMYFSIAPEIWGACRYQAEYGAPFAILGLTLLIQRTHSYLKTRIWIARVIVPVGIAVGVGVVSIQSYSQLSQNTLTADQRKSSPWMATKVLAEGVYEYRAAFTKIKEDGFAGQTYVHGTVYGTFYEVMYGFSWSEVIKQQKLLQDLCHSPKAWLMGCPAIPSAKEIQKNIQVNAVLLSNLDGEAMGGELLSLGWIEKAAFKNSKWGSTIRYLVRSGPR